MRTWLGLDKLGVCKDVRRMIWALLTPFDRACIMAAHTLMTPDRAELIAKAAYFHVKDNDPRIVYVVGLVIQYHLSFYQYVSITMMRNLMAQGWQFDIHHISKCSTCHPTSENAKHFAIYAIYYNHKQALDWVAMSNIYTSRFLQFNHNGKGIRVSSAGAIAMIAGWGELAGTLCLQKKYNLRQLEECVDRAPDDQTLLRFLVNIHMSWEMRTELSRVIEDRDLNTLYPHMMSKFRASIVKGWGISINNA